MRALYLVVLLVGCGGDETKKVVDKHRAASKAQLAKIAALASTAEKQAPVTADEWHLPAGVKLDFSMTVYAGDQPAKPNPAYNAALAPLEVLATPCTSEPPTWKTGSTQTINLGSTHWWLKFPACQVETGKFPSGEQEDADQLDTGFKQLEGTKYLLVVRLRDLESPELLMKELEERKMEHFEPGHIGGDGVLYDVASGAYLGGFALDVRLPESEEVVNGAGVEDQLRSKLVELASHQITDKLKPLGNPPTP